MFLSISLRSSPRRMVSTNFVVDRCENTSFQGEWRGGGLGKVEKVPIGDLHHLTRPFVLHLYFCLIAAQVREVLSILCVVFFFVSH